MIYIAIPVFIVCLLTLRKHLHKYTYEKPIFGDFKDPTPKIVTFAFTSLFLVALISSLISIYEILKIFDSTQGSTAAYTYLIFYFLFFIYIVKISNKKT